MNEAYEGMSKGQKKLATYITTNYDTAVFMTAAKLGAMVGVSESTTVRFATLLGYSGFPEFHKALEELVKDKLHSVQRIEITASKMTETQVLETVMESDAEKIKLTLETISKSAFDEAVESIMSARRIYVVGIRTCTPLAQFLGFYLNLLFDDVTIVTTNSASEIFEQMINVNNEDVVIGISFPRYSMRTLKAMEFANDRNAKVISITDDKNSPLNLYSSCNLLAKSDMATVVDSLVAPLSVINALVVTLCMKKPDYVTGKLDMLDKLWEDYQVYSGDEMNIPDGKVAITSTGTSEE
jgi:DNA-binding MurR/RpiR family transcriptional regulator